MDVVKKMKATFEPARPTRLSQDSNICSTNVTEGAEGLRYILLVNE
jgi:hypothetical protein